MSITLIYTVVVLSTIGIVSAIILYYVSQKFKVHEDPRIDQIEEALPSANCGGCGYAGCRAFAEACVAENELSALFCPVGGNDCMSEIAGILGLEAVQKAPKVAVLPERVSIVRKPMHSTELNPVLPLLRFTAAKPVVHSVVLATVIA